MTYLPIGGRRMATLLELFAATSLISWLALGVLERKPQARDAAATVRPVLEREGAGVRFDYLPSENQTDACTVTLRSEKRRKQIRCHWETRTFVDNTKSEHARPHFPRDLDAAACVTRRVDCISDKVYQQLVELIAVGSQRDRGSGPHVDRAALFKPRHAIDPGIHVNRSKGRRR